MASMRLALCLAALLATTHLASAQITGSNAREAAMRSRERSESGGSSISGTTTDSGSGRSSGQQTANTFGTLGTVGGVAAGAASQGGLIGMGGSSNGNQNGGNNIGNLNGNSNGGGNLIGGNGNSNGNSNLGDRNGAPIFMDNSTLFCRAEAALLLQPPLRLALCQPRCARRGCVIYSCRPGVQHLYVYRPIDGAGVHWMSVECRVPILYRDRGVAFCCAGNGNGNQNGGLITGVSGGTGYAFSAAAHGLQ